MFRLEKLQIDGYKNLTGNYDFSNNKGYIALIGLNGSGKSNLLESISIIFDKLINNNGRQIPFNYALDYQINGDTYSRKKKVAIKNGEKLSLTKMTYPSSIIGCYSGEDRRWWHLAFERYYNSYFNRAINKNEYIPQFIYINYTCWKIALLSLVCTNKASIKDFLKNVLGITSPLDVEVDFVIDPSKKDGFKTHPAISWFDRITNEGFESINANFIYSTDIISNGKFISEDKKGNFIFHYLYLLSQPRKNDTNKIDKLIEKISIKIKGLNFNNLSEGQKKLILIECITKVLGDENSLVLLDEPDAHTHIAMKKDLLKLISEFEGQTIMTTHSPMFLNKRWDGYDENNIFYIHDGKIEDTEPLKHLSELTDNEIDYFEGSFILSSKKILVTEGPYDILYIKHAINKFSDENPNYLKIRDHVAFLHAGGANNAKALYEQTISPVLSKTENIVFVFDYDKEGFVGLTQLRESISVNHDTKTKCIFYQTNYDYDWLDKPQNINSYMAEDLFDSNSYASVVEALHIIHTHKEFRNRTQATSDAIKEHIKSSYSSFEKEWLQNFKPVLNKLLDIFDLN